MKSVKPKVGKTDNKDQLHCEELLSGVKTFEKPEIPHAALETPEGKNNGAEPAVYQNKRKART